MRWQYIGYYAPRGTYEWSHFWAWSNGEDVATCPMSELDYSRVGDFPPVNSDIHYGAVSQYDGDIIALCNDWGLVR